MPVTSFDDVRAILECFDEAQDGVSHDALWWRTDGEYAPITFFVNCNDLFVWGCADCEEITAADVPEFRSAINDINNAEGGCAYAHADSLWTARKRGQRPQMAYYKHFSPAEAVLFDACGPEETQYGRKVKVA